MKHIYENFEEIASDFCDGNSFTHDNREHSKAECNGWQHGVKEFAKFLDGHGLSIVANPEIYDVLWNEAKKRIFNKASIDRELEG